MPAGWVLALAMMFSPFDAMANPLAVDLGAAGNFAVLAGSGITIAAPVESTVITRDLGTYPTATLTGLSNLVLNGVNHAGDAVTQTAKADLATAYADAAGRPPTRVFEPISDVGGETLLAGVYQNPSSFGITGTLTLDAQGDPDAVWIFQAGSTLITASGSHVTLTNGAQASHVFWQVGSSATLGTGSDFGGNILALTSITLNTGATVDGRALARNGAVTLDNNAIASVPDFAVTQGMMRARSAVESAFPTNNNLRTGDMGAAAVYWIAAGPTNAQGQYTQVNMDYDLICWDSPSYNETSNNVWSKIGTIRTNWFTDAPGQDIPRSQMRFYRAAYKDRWQRTNVVDGLPRRPVASEEVYAMHNLVLSEGFNFVGLHGLPCTNTFLGVFGADTNFWPAGASPLNSTRIEFYSSGTHAALAEFYFFGADGHWYSTNGVPVTTNLQPPDFFTRGFSITLPSPLPAQYVTTNALDVAQPGSNLPAMVWHPILKVPTNGPAGGSFHHVMAMGEHRPAPEELAYNLVALNLPVSAHPAAMRLIESGFVKGAAGSSDEIYTLNTATKGVRMGSTLYCDTNGVWRFVADNGLVPANYFKPNDVIVVVSRNGGLGNNWTWTYHPTNFYVLPTRWMGQ